MSDTPDIYALTAAARAGQPDAQYRLGAWYFSQGEINPALDWLNHAARDHVPDASNLLGVIYLNGIGTPCDPGKAAELFHVAAKQDLKEAHFNLAGLLFNSYRVPREDSSASQHLMRAAELGHRAALRVLGYLHMADRDADSLLLAAQCFSRAALLGDVHAEYMLGMCYLTGSGVNTNQDEAAYWLASAANKRLYCASSRLRSLEMEMGKERLQWLLLNHVSEAKRRVSGSLELHPPSIRITADSRPQQRPGIVSEYPGILDANLCDYLINLAAPRLLPSGVVDPISGKPLKTALRTSSSMNFELSMYDMAVGFICRQLASLADIDPENAEPISVLRYLPGQEYKPHYDHFAVDEHGVPRMQDKGGQRTVTVFVYLNDVEAGGETDFPRLAVRVQPGKGKAVAFANCEVDGTPNPATLHAGMPVIRGEKWLATLWFRERRFNWA